MMTHEDVLVLVGAINGVRDAINGLGVAVAASALPIVVGISMVRNQISNLVKRKNA